MSNVSYLDVRDPGSSGHPDTVLTEPGCYLITVQTRDGQQLFGSVYRGRMILNDFGVIANRAWHRTVGLRRDLHADELIVMPNHLHGIVWVLERGGEAVPNSDIGLIYGTKSKVPPRSLDAIVNRFKADAAIQIHEIEPCCGDRIWKRSFEKESVGSRLELEEIRESVRRNPENWWEDELRPRIFTDKTGGRSV